MLPSSGRKRQRQLQRCVGWARTLPHGLAARALEGVIQELQEINRFKTSKFPAVRGFALHAECQMPTPAAPLEQPPQDNSPAHLRSRQREPKGGACAVPLLQVGEVGLAEGGVCRQRGSGGVATGMKDVLEGAHASCHGPLTAAGRHRLPIAATLCRRPLPQQARLHKLTGSRRSPAACAATCNKCVQPNQRAPTCHVRILHEASHLSAILHAKCKHRDAVQQVAGGHDACRAREASQRGMAASPQQGTPVRLEAEASTPLRRRAVAAWVKCRRPSCAQHERHAPAGSAGP